MRAGAAQPGLFEVTTSRLQAGGLFVDLAEGRSLGDIVLTSTDERTGQLYQSWALENPRVVHYRTADPLRVDLAFGFDAIESTTVSFEGGRPDVQQTSRWEMGGATPVISGGGPGHQSASAGAGDLLHIGEHVLDVSSYHWGAAAPVDFAPRGRPSST